MLSSELNLEDIKDASLKILSSDTIQHLGLKLDGLKIFLSDNGKRIHRDWRGLAECAGIEVSCLRSVRVSPTESCITLWSKNGGTIGQLVHALETMDRYDVKDDYSLKILNDYTRSLKLVPITTQFNQFKILTIDDAKSIKNGRSFEVYAALVLYVDEDVDFVKKMVEELEGKHDIKLCLLDRELLSGVGLEIEGVIEIIQSRCERVIVVLSPAFLESSTNNFFTVFAQSLGIAQSRRVVIPCMVKPCMKPSCISALHSLDYFRTNGHWDYWGKLAASINHEGPTINGQRVVATKMGAQPVTERSGRLNSSSKTTTKVNDAAIGDLVNGLPDVPLEPCSMTSLDSSSQKSRGVRKKVKNWAKNLRKKLPDA